MKCCINNLKEVTRLKIAAIAGSNANHSYNRMLLEFIARHFSDDDMIVVFQAPMLLLLPAQNITTLLPLL